MIKNWLAILERLYMIFRIRPFSGGSKIRAVKKEQKHYHFDWTGIANESLRFENCIALHLLKWVHFQQDAKGLDYELQYFRDIDGREVDFVITRDGKPEYFIETKWGDADVGKGLKYLRHKFPEVEAWQLTCESNKDYLSKENIRICPAYKFLINLV